MDNRHLIHDKEVVSHIDQMSQNNHNVTTRDFINSKLYRKYDRKDKRIEQINYIDPVSYQRTIIQGAN